MMRKRFIDGISKHMGKRNLVWIGMRGTDAEALLPIPQLAMAFSVITPLESEQGVSDVCLETMQKKRKDIHSYEFDRDNSRETGIMHGLLYAAFNKPSVVIPYRPDNFLTTAYFPQAEHVKCLSLSYQQVSALENKPWVENELRELGVRTLPWSYHGQHSKPDFDRLLSKGPIIIRSGDPSTHGGASLSIIREPDQINLSRIRSSPLYSASRYLEPNIPLSVNACLFHDGTISLHGPSVQLLGIPSCTGFQLGYSGNDFGLVRNLDDEILDGLERTAMEVGKWLARMGYLGAFGLDVVEYRHHLYVAEVNPRFLGSSLVGARLDEELGRPDLFLSHMAAFFGMPAPPHLPLRELARQQGKVSHVLCNNRTSEVVFFDGPAVHEQDGIDFIHLPARDIGVEHEGLIFRALVKDSVTTSGHSLLKHYEDRITAMAEAFSPRQTPRQGMRRQLTRTGR